MNIPMKLIVCVWLGMLQLCTAGEPDIASIFSRLKLTMTPADASKVMKAEGAELKADGTAVGAWGSLPRIPGRVEDVSVKLGIESPQAAQIWKIGDRWIRLHYAPNKLSKDREPILFWIEVMKPPSPDTKGNNKPNPKPYDNQLPPP